MSAPASTAVVNRRRPGPDTLDFFPTPPWATRALIHEVIWKFFGTFGVGKVALDPCCGAGHMAIPLKESFPRVIATDVHDWGFGDRRDFDFTLAQPGDFAEDIDWIIANPPFVLAEEFLAAARRLKPKSGIAMLLRLNWLEGEARHDKIFSSIFRPAFVCPFAERVPMIEGVWDPEARSATAYAWFVFPPHPRRVFTSIHHIRPGAALRYAKWEDAALATPGEAARRLAARKAVGEPVEDVPPNLFDAD